MWSTTSPGVSNKRVDPRQKHVKPQLLALFDNLDLDVGQQHPVRTCGGAQSHELQHAPRTKQCARSEAVATTWLRCHKVLFAGFAMV
jgi:hypothetical protein